MVGMTESEVVKKLAFELEMEPRTLLKFILTYRVCPDTGYKTCWVQKTLMPQHYAYSMTRYYLNVIPRKKRNKVVRSTTGFPVKEMGQPHTLMLYQP
jgi:hypothetical protein